MELYIIILILCLICFYEERKNNIRKIKTRNKKKGRGKMPKELIKEFIGKVCLIKTNTVEFFEITGRIIEVEDNWIKLKYKNNIQLINGDTIARIEILPESYQNKKVYD